MARMARNTANMTPQKANSAANAPKASNAPLVADAGTPQSTAHSTKATRTKSTTQIRLPRLRNLITTNTPTMTTTTAKAEKAEKVNAVPARAKDTAPPHHASANRLGRCPDFPELKENHQARAKDAPRANPTAKEPSVGTITPKTFLTSTT